MPENHHRLSDILTGLKIRSGISGALLGGGLLRGQGFHMHGPLAFPAGLILGVITGDRGCSSAGRCVLSVLAGPGAAADGEKRRRGNIQHRMFNFER